MSAGYRPNPQPNTSNGVTKVPAGVYVAKIVLVQNDKHGEYGPQLKLGLDIAEGEYADAYMRRYESDVKYAKDHPEENRKAHWKGTIKFRYADEHNPDPDHDTRNNARLDDALWRIVQSNPGLHIDWEHIEQQLKGKLVGINVIEDEYNGYTFTKIGRLEIADEVRNGTVKPMKPWKRAGQTQQAPAAAAYTPVATPPELPF